MNAIEEKCLKKGVRLTDQRKTIAKVISESKEVYGSKDHPDVDELHKRVTSIDNKISIDQLLTTITVSTQQLAKRQITWKNKFKVSYPIIYRKLDYINLSEYIARNLK